MRNGTGMNNNFKLRVGIKTRNGRRKTIKTGRRFLEMKKFRFTARKMKSAKLDSKEINQKVGIKRKHRVDKNKGQIDRVIRYPLQQK